MIKQNPQGNIVKVHEVVVTRDILVTKIQHLKAQAEPILNQLTAAQLDLRAYDELKNAQTAPATHSGGII